MISSVFFSQKYGFIEEKYELMAKLKYIWDFLSLISLYLNKSIVNPGIAAAFVPQSQDMEKFVKMVHNKYGCDKTFKGYRW